MSRVLKGFLTSIEGGKPFEFVESSLAPSPSDKEQWRAFLEELGVGFRVIREKGSWVEFIGTRVSLAYEQYMKRCVDPSQGFGIVPEPERGHGFDIRSRDHDGKSLLIESKGIGEAEGEVRLKPTTLAQALYRENRDRFFIYVVSDALSRPRINVVPGTSLSENLLMSLATVDMKASKLPIKTSMLTESFWEVV